MVTVVTEGIFSYCGVKVKIDTDRYLGPETATVRAQGEAVGHVTTERIRLADAVARRRPSSDRRFEEGRARHLRRADGFEQLQAGRTRPSTAARRVVVQAGYPPIVNGVAEERMRVGCGSATIGMFAKQWHGKVDEVVVVDDHITGVLERTSGRQVARYSRDRNQDEGTALDARALFPGRRARHRLGRYQDLRSAVDSRVRSIRGRLVPA